MLRPFLFVLPFVLSIAWVQCEVIDCTSHLLTLRVLLMVLLPVYMCPASHPEHVPPSCTGFLITSQCFQTISIFFFCAGMEMILPNKTRFRLMMENKFEQIRHQLKNQSLCYFLFRFLHVFFCVGFLWAVWFPVGELATLKYPLGVNESTLRWAGIPSRLYFHPVFQDRLQIRRHLTNKWWWAKERDEWYNPWLKVVDTGQSQPYVALYQTVTTKVEHTIV